MGWPAPSHVTRVIVDSYCLAPFASVCLHPFGLHSDSLESTLILALSWCAGEAPLTPPRDKSKTELCLPVSLSTYDCHDLTYHMSLQASVVTLRSAMHLNTGLDFAFFYLEWFNRVSPWLNVVHPIRHHSDGT